MAVRIQLRRDTASNWVSSNPILRAGEIGIETDTLKFKVGTGNQTWTAITAYANVVPTDLNNTLDGYLQVGDLSNTVAELVGGNLYVPSDSIIFEGSTDNNFELTLVAPDVTSDRTVNLPNANTTLVGTDTADTLSNKSISLGSNTVSATLAQLNTAVSDANLVSLDGAETLTNKTLTSPIISTISNTGTITIPSSTDTLVGRATTDTLTNKSISLATNTVTSTLAELNTAISDADLASIAGAETLTNKTLTSPVISGLQISDGSIVIEGSTADNFETTLIFTDPAADRTITFQDVTGTVALLGDISAATGGSVTETGVQTLTNKTLTSPIISGLTISDGSIIVEGTTNDANETTLLFTDPTEDRTITFPNATGTVAFTTDVDTRLALAGGTMTGAIAMGTNKITGLGSPTDAADAATKSYVDNTTAGLNFHAAVHSATTVNLDATYSNGTAGVGATLTANANGALVVDSITQNVGERVLVKNQTTGLQNGIYEVTATGDVSNPWVLTRATDADNSPSGEVAYGDFTFVQQGSTNAGFGYILNTTGTITIGTTSISYTQFNAGQVVIAGNGLTEATPGTLSINTAVTVDLNTAQTLTNKTLTSPVINTPTGISKSDVGLGNVDNTSDANKPVSTATQTALDLKVNNSDPAVDYYITNSGASSYLVNGVSNGNIYFEKGKKYRIHVNASGHPFWIQTSSGGYNSGSVYNTGITNNGTASGHIIVELASSAPQLYYACEYHSSMAGSIVTGTTFETYKALSDLSNVNNTSDANKPVSTATQTALDLKIDESIFDAKGDLISASAADTPIKLSSGTNNQVLIVNTSTASGLEWSSTLTGLTLSSPEVTGSGISFEGSTADANETTLTVVDPTADRTITLPDQSGTVALKDLEINTQTGTTYTTVLADNGKLITLNNASAITVTVPLNSSVAYPIGAQITLAQIGAGQVTIAGAGGVTVNATPGLKLRTQYSLATLIKLGTDSWIVTGDLSA